MIKILFFIDTTLKSGGAEKVLCTLVNNMDQSKFDITVQTAWPEEAQKYLAPGVKYRSLFPRKNTANHILFRLETMLGLTYRMRMKADYDIEVAYLECGPTKIIASSTNQKAVKLAWVHCNLREMTKDADSFIKKSAKWYQKFHKVVCVSENVKETYVDLFGSVPEAVVLYNTVDSNEILKKANEQMLKTAIKKRPVIVTVGRLYKPKGYDRLLRIHKKLHDEGYEYNLWILGDGPQKDELDKFVLENALSESVVFHGFQSNPYPFISNADIVVCSSHYEGFSTVVTEALILGKPVVTTECSGMRELLGDSEYGLITENSEEGIYQGLKKMLDEPELLKKYEDLARERGKAFCKEHLVKQTEDFFEEALGVKRAQ